MRLPGLRVAAVSAVALVAACGHDHDHDHELNRVEIIDRGQTAQPVIATWIAGEGWEGELPEVGIGDDDRLSLGVRMFDGEGEQLIERDGEYTARYALADGAAAGILDFDQFELYHGDHVHMYGAAEGTTRIVFVLWHDDHADANTDPIDITVRGDATGYREMQRVEIRDRSQTERPVVATWEHGQGWSGELPVVNLSGENALGRPSLGVDIYDSNDVLLQEASDEWSARYYVAPDATGGVINTEPDESILFHGDHVHIYALEPDDADAGHSTEIIFVLWHVDHSEAETSPIELRVVGAPDEYLARVLIRDRNATAGRPVVAEWNVGAGWTFENSSGDAFPDFPVIDIAADGARLSLGVDIFDSARRNLSLPGFNYRPGYEVLDSADDHVLAYIGDDVRRPVGNDTEDVVADAGLLFHSDHVHVYPLLDPGGDPEFVEGVDSLVFGLRVDDAFIEGRTDGLEIEVIDSDE
jgi:hypothetical protein